MNRWILPLACPLVAYLFCGFIAWDFNPGNWHGEGRLVCVIFATMAAGLIGLVVNENGGAA